MKGDELADANSSIRIILYSSPPLPLGNKARV